MMWNLENATLAEVRVEMDCTPTKEGFRRVQALRWLYEGRSREEVTAPSCFSPRPVLSFIHAFNLARLEHAAADGDTTCPQHKSPRRSCQ